MRVDESSCGSRSRLSSRLACSACPSAQAGPAGMPTSTSRVIEFVLVRTVASTPSRIRSRPANSSRARRRVETLHLVDGEQHRRLIAKRVNGN